MPGQASDDELKDELEQYVPPNGPEHQGPGFEELMLLVFSGPMCFERLEEESESEESEDDAADEREGDQS